MNKHNRPRATKVLQALIHGVDPETGSELPEGTILSRADVIRALLTSIDAIEQIDARAARRAHLPEGVGQPWTNDEEVTLKMEFQGGTPIPDIANAHKRRPHRT